MNPISNQSDVDEIIEEIVGTFIALKFDVDTDEFSDGTLERWNNMKQALKELIVEARIEELKLHATEWVEINEDGTINPTVVHDRIKQLQSKKIKEK